MKRSTKTRDDIEQEDEDGTWPTSSFVLYPDLCSVRMVCLGCWAIERSFDEYPCNQCRTNRPSNYSKSKPKIRRIHD